MRKSVRPPSLNSLTLPHVSYENVSPLHALPAKKLVVSLGRVQLLVSTQHQAAEHHGGGVWSSLGVHSVVLLAVAPCGTSSYLRQPCEPYVTPKHALEPSLVLVSAQLTSANML